MTKEELYKKIDIDTPADFAYFEQMAELIETEEEISFDQVFDVLSEVDAETLATLVENYFEEFNNAIPDSDDDFVCLIDSVKQNLLLAAQSIDDTRGSFAQQLFYFRNWLRKADGALIDKEPATILAAVTENRIEKLGGVSHRYEFPAVADYELEEISLSLGRYSKVDILNSQTDEDDTEDFDN